MVLLVISHKMVLSIKTLLILYHVYAQLALQIKVGVCIGNIIAYVSNNVVDHGLRIVI